MKPTPKALASKMAHCEMSLVCLPRHLAKKGDITMPQYFANALMSRRGDRSAFIDSDDSVNSLSDNAT
jgi:hypothetical protein